MLTTSHLQQFRAAPGLLGKSTVAGVLTNHPIDVSCTYGQIFFNMPPAGRAAALAIFDLGGDTTQPKVEASEEASENPISATDSRTPKRPRLSRIHQIAEVVLPLRTRARHAKADKHGFKVEHDPLALPTSTSEWHTIKRESVEPDSQRLVEVFEEASDDQIRDALAGMKNPLAKTKKSSAMPDRILYNRLKVIGFDIYPVEESVNKYFPFSRYFFASRFGGSFVDTFPTPSKQMLQRHGINDWAFLSLFYNPHAPQIPGAPGLFYESSDATQQPYTKRVFFRLDDDKWIYVGHYRFAMAQSLTVPEYLTLSDKVQKTWTRRITEAPSWAHEILARVYLRCIRNVQNPTTEEVEDVIKKRPAALKTITEEQIAEAYLNNQERIGVYTMKCIQYDAQWLAGLVDDYPAWKKEREENLRRKKKKAKNATKVRKGDTHDHRVLKRKAPLEPQDRSSNESLQGSAFEADLTELDDEEIE